MARASERGAGGEGPLCILLHVPKCAGTTIETHLARHLGPARFWSPSKRTRRLPLEMLGRKYDSVLPGPAAGVRAVSGHFVGRSVEGLLPRRPVWRAVILREPAALQLSWYNYRMMRYRAQGRAHYDFALHLRTLPPDPVAHFLLERWLEMPWWRIAALAPAAKRALLDGMLAAFDAVADISRADAVLAAAASRLGIPATAERANAAADWRARAEWHPLRREELDQATADLLDRRTRLDAYLWRRWALGDHGADLDPAAVASFAASELARPAAELHRRRLRG